MRNLDFSSSQRTCILIPHMGAGNMPDFGQIKNHLENELGVEVINTDLSDRESLRKLPWDRISVVDLSNMRGCLTSFDKYTGILDRLHDFMEEAGYGNDEVSIVPAYDDINWIASKTTYLSYLDTKGIPVIPTKNLCLLKTPEDASIISQPDNIKSSIEDMFSFIEQSYKSKFVLKPSTSSLGRGLVFLEYKQDSGSYDVLIPHENEEPHVIHCSDREELTDKFLKPYFMNTTSHDHRFLFQEYIENLETSSVFINGTPHYVERTQGDQSHIAHARFGGTDTVIEKVDKKLIEFADQVMKSLPLSIQRSPFLRVDVMKDLETGEYILSELEGAGATRLWLTESGRIEDYTRMLLHCPIKKHEATNDNLPDDMIYPNHLQL